MLETYGAHDSFPGRTKTSCNALELEMTIGTRTGTCGIAPAL